MGAKRLNWSEIRVLMGNGYHVSIIGAEVMCGASGSLYICLVIQYTVLGKLPPSFLGIIRLK